MKEGDKTLEKADPGIGTGCEHTDRIHVTQEGNCQQAIVDRDHYQGHKKPPSSNESRSHP